MSAAVVSALMFLSSSADAAGLGKMTVLSSLGQPLRAEIELTSVTKEEAGSITARLAPMESYRQANIDFNPALQSLQFAIEQRGTGQIIRVTSTQPINDPFVDMLLEVGSPTARLLREYTFLLDPPETRITQSAQFSAQPAAAAKSAPQAAANPPPAKIIPAPAKAATNLNQQRTETVDSSPPASVLEGEKRASEYVVKKGDSLGAIARRVRPDGISLDQMLVALYRGNPEAFVDKNMNRLRSGQILGIPSASAAGVIGSSEARSLIVAQAADFNEYRKKLAGQVAAASPSQAPETGQSATGKVTSRVNDAAGNPDDTRDKLKLSKAGATSNSEAQAASSADAEDRIAQIKALEEANARVRELEKNVGDLQNLLAFKNKELADRQASANAAVPQTAATAVSAMPIDKPGDAVPGAPEAAGRQVNSETPVAAPDQPLVGPAQKAPLTTAETSVAASTAKPDAAARRDAPKPATQSLNVEQPDFLDDPINHPWFMPLAGLLAIGLGSVGIFSSVRRKKQQRFEDSLLSDSSLKANSLFGSTGGQSVDTNNSVFNSSFTPSASQLDTNEVDPVAEADVYIAYGRDVQAEEILKEALRTQPERNAVRLKLLEIYANRKDARAFETVASDLFAISKGEGDDWQQVCSLGLGIDPNNPLYAGGKLPAGFADKTASLSSPTVPMESGQGHAISGHRGIDGLEESSDNALDFESANEQSEELTTIFAGKADEAPPEENDHLTQGVASRPESEVLENIEKLKLDGYADEELSSSATALGVAHSDPAADFTSQLATLNFDLDEALPGGKSLTPGGNQSDQDSGEKSLEFDFNLDDLVIQKASPTASTSPGLELGDALMEESQFASIDTSKMDANTGGTQARPSVTVMDLDLAGINLDLSSPAGEGHDALAASKVETAVTNTSQVSTNPEMATKLDLAAAYREIGDKEGARELLDEVLRGGTAGQIAEAQQMLEKLS